MFSDDLINIKKRKRKQEAKVVKHQANTSFGTIAMAMSSWNRSLQA